MEEALQAAAEAVLGQAYAPYSRFRVGAAVRTASGRVHAGCNVENVSYGLTICAERSAIARAVAEEGPEVRIVAVAVVHDGLEPCAPCGACRQVIAEFGGLETTVRYRSTEGVVERAAGDLLPDTFGFPRPKTSQGPFA
jgi:homotetrameric cytidine deaminase